MTLKVNADPLLPALNKDKDSAVDDWSIELISELTLLFGDMTRAINELCDGKLDALQMTKTRSAPIGPVSGQVNYADGVGWNPGAGEGFYGYYGAAWHLLG